MRNFIKNDEKGVPILSKSSLMVIIVGIYELYKAASA
jgi:hypothetical protein